MSQQILEQTSYVTGSVMWIHMRKLLSVPDLTLKKALEIAQGSEAAVKMAKSLKVVDTSINTVTKAKVKCYNCGQTSHTANDCKFRDVDWEIMGT